MSPRADVAAPALASRESPPAHRPSPEGVAAQEIEPSTAGEVTMDGVCSEKGGVVATEYGIQRLRPQRAGSWRFLASTLLFALLASMAALTSTSADAQGAGTPPQISCSWALVDTDADLGNGVAYGPDAAAGQVPSAPGTPCVYDASSGALVQPGGVANMIQIRPNAADAPSQVAVELWTAVSHPVGPFTDGGGGVEFLVTGPGGSAEHLVGSLASCQGDVTPGAMWSAASTQAGGAGELAWSAVTNGDEAGLWDRCRQGAVSLYRAQWLVSNADVCGAYTVQTVATAYGATAVLDHQVDVVCFIEVGIDFSRLDFDSLSGGFTAEVEGDRTFGTTGAPTVINRGNAPMNVGLSMTPMFTGGSNVLIDDFSAEFGRSGPSGRFDELPVDGGVAWFVSTASATLVPADELVLCANQTGRLDVMAHPPAGLPEGAYGGGFTVWGTIAPAGCGR
ncbi:MAG: hypothetical protein KDB21_20035 [Acidimicrobiales bacterium]|nr:hypothetical protein [Acidimicrobiales bacterium]